MLCHVWEKSGIVFFKQSIFHRDIFTFAHLPKNLFILSFEELMRI